MKKLRKIAPIILALIIASTAIMMKIMEPHKESDTWLNIMENQSIDFRFKHRGDIPNSDKIVLAVVDEKSLFKEGNWIWPRYKFAEMLSVLSEAGAKVVAFDIVFAEPDTNSGQINSIIHDIQRQYLQKHGEPDDFIHYLTQYQQTKDNDQLLADAIKHSKSAIVLGYYFEFEQQAYLNDEDIQHLAHNITHGAYKNILRSPGIAAGEEINMFEPTVYPQSNITIISQATPYSGYFNMLPDKDGTVRRMQSVIRHDDQLYPPLSLAALSCYLDTGIGIRFVKNEEGRCAVDRLFIGDKIIPTDDMGRFYINYRGGGKTFPHISITDILHRNFPAGTFKDKIVIVGATAIGIYDVRVTPMDELFPGAEVHANIIDMILHDSMLKKPSWGPAFYVMAVLLGTLLLALLLPRSGAIPGALIAAALTLCYYYTVQYIFNKGYIVELVIPLLSIISAYIIITIYIYFAESRKKAFIKNAFSTYLAPAIVEQLIEHPDKLVLGGESRKITAFFSDVQSFTSISEKLSPQELVELLNEFLTEMTDIILQYQGTVDKFEGDAIIAFFGAPVELENQAESACRSSVMMQKKLAELRAKWKNAGKPELKMRIGLFTGDAVIGNMGSKNRMDYTMMGDTVNTAARLEGTNKNYGTYILMGENTKNKINPEEFFIREIDSIQVVGKQKPINIYELVGFQQDIDQNFRQAAESYAAGLAAYRLGNWEQAIAFFDQALEYQPNDPPTNTIRARCIEYQLTPPPSPWEGVFMMKTK